MFECEDRHWWYVALHKLIIRHVERERKSKGRLEILDAGCGTGRLCQLMALFGAVQGLDHSDNALAFCRERGLTSLFKADLNTADLGESRYDIITSIDVLYHNAIEDDAVILKKLFAALKPGGVLILNLPAYEFLRSSHDLAVHTKKRYTLAVVSAMLRKTGYRVDTISYRVSFLFLPIACYRWGLKLAHRRRPEQPVKSDVRLPSAFINKVLLIVTLAENCVIGMCPVPFGSSVFAVARRPWPLSLSAETGSPAFDREQDDEQDGKR